MTSILFSLSILFGGMGKNPHFPLLNAHTDDVNHLGSLIEGFSRTVPADKGFLSEYQQQLWLDTQQTQVITPVKNNMETSPEQVKLVRKTKYWRKPVAGGRLTTE